MGMASCKEERTAISPARKGTVAIPSDSMKYCTASTVERTSGRLTSETVEMTLGEEKEINRAVG